MVGVVRWATVAVVTSARHSLCRNSSADARDAVANALADHPTRPMGLGYRALLLCFVHRRVRGISATHKHPPNPLTHECTHALTPHPNPLTHTHIPQSHSASPPHPSQKTITHTHAIPPIHSRAQTADRLQALRFCCVPGKQTTDIVTATDLARVKVVGVYMYATQAHLVINISQYCHLSNK